MTGMRAALSSQLNAFIDEVKVPTAQGPDIHERYCSASRIESDTDAALQ